MSLTDLFFLGWLSASQTHATGQFHFQNQCHNGQHSSYSHLAAEAKLTCSVSVADSKATLLVSIAFLTTNTATTPLTGNQVSVSCTLGSTTNAMLILHFYFQNPAALVVKNWR